MVRVGVQSVNGDTLANVERKGDRERVARTLESLARYGVPYSVDHIIGLPGEGAADQVAALEFYNERRPRRIVAHWMTFFPGTTAFDRARSEGLLSESDARKIMDGDVGPGFMFDGNGDYRDREALRRLSAMFDLLPVLPRDAVSWLLENDRYKHLHGQAFFRQLGALALVLKGEPATRERLTHIALTTAAATVDTLKRRIRAKVASPSA
jgi:hypothetical protein